MCRAEACAETRSYAKGYCRYHYERQRRGQSLDVQRRLWTRGGAICYHGGCKDRAKAQGFCELHYKRHRKGLPMDMPLRQAARFSCTYDGCSKPCGKSNLCPTHWKRVWTRTHGASRRALKRSAFVEHVNIEQLRERDASRCGLCGCHVDPSLQWPDPMSQSIDHIVPLSLDGEHSYGNTQLAHVSCNASKGNRISAKEPA